MTIRWLERKPKLRVIVAAQGADLAEGLSRRGRSLPRERRLTSDERSGAEEWQTKAKWHPLTATVGPFRPLISSQQQWPDGFLVNYNRSFKWWQRRQVDHVSKCFLFGAEPPIAGGPGGSGVLRPQCFRFLQGSERGNPGCGEEVRDAPRPPRTDA